MDRDLEGDNFYCHARKITAILGQVQAPLTPFSFMSKIWVHTVLWILSSLPSQGQRCSSCHSSMGHVSPDGARPLLGAWEGNQPGRPAHPTPHLRLQRRSSRWEQASHSTRVLAQRLDPGKAASCREELISLLDMQCGRVQADKMSSRHKILSEDHVELHRPVGQLPGWALTACGTPTSWRWHRLLTAVPSAEAVESLRARSKLKES